jgi:AcrR family transcriptional regulator
MARATSKSGKPKKSRDYHLPPGAAREALLQSAIRLLNERGPGNVSLNDVARDAALNPALVKYYFGSKERLFEAVIEQIVGEWRTEILAATSEDLSPEQELRQRARATMYFLRRYPSLMRLIRQQIMANSKESRFFIEKFMRLNFTEHRKILQNGIQQGIFRKVDPVLFFASYISTGDLYTFSRPILLDVFGLQENEDKLFERFVEHSVDMLLSGVTIRGNADKKRRPRQRGAI